jgi:hypothetical protein
VNRKIAGTASAKEGEHRTRDVDSHTRPPALGRLLARGRWWLPSAKEGEHRTRDIGQSHSSASAVGSISSFPASCCRAKKATFVSGSRTVGGKDFSVVEWFMLTTVREGEPKMHAVGSHTCWLQVKVATGEKCIFWSTDCNENI